MGEKMKLYGFNNLTKSLSFNIYDVCYAKTAREQKDYIAYIDEQYNSERLTNILTSLTDMIGARVLNIAKQDYEPQGASVTILIAEKTMVPAGDMQLAHLDKSHVTVHTLPARRRAVRRARPRRTATWPTTPDGRASPPVREPRWSGARRAAAGNDGSEPSPQT
mgnify:CR=1 FL=1